MSFVTMATGSEALVTLGVDHQGDGHNTAKHSDDRYASGRALVVDRLVLFTFTVKLVAQARPHGRGHDQRTVPLGVAPDWCD
jgi:hypothetical protein